MPSDQVRPAGRLGFSEAEASMVMTLNNSHYCAPGGDTERHPAPDLPMSSSDIWQKKRTSLSFRATRQIVTGYEKIVMIIFETTRPLHLVMADLQSRFRVELCHTALHGQQLQISATFSCDNANDFLRPVRMLLRLSRGCRRSSRMCAPASIGPGCAGNSKIGEAQEAIQIIATAVLLVAGSSSAFADEPGAFLVNSNLGQSSYTVASNTAFGTSTTAPSTGYSI
jgi:hypothetical protein